MKNLIFLAFFLLTGCVVQTQENCPITDVESEFYKRKFGENMSLDSIDRTIFKYVPWSQHPSQYTYNLTIYLSNEGNRIDSAAFRIKVDSTALFVVDYMTKEKRKLHKFFLNFYLNENSMWFIYNVNEKNQPELQEMED